MNKNEVVEKIFQTLQSQNFADWYNKGGFDAFISGDYDFEAFSPDRMEREVKKEIEKLFHLT